MGAFGFALNSLARGGSAVGFGLAQLDFRRRDARGLRDRDTGRAPVHT
jgi:hypothetical protein